MSRRGAMAVIAGLLLLAGCAKEDGPPAVGSDAGELPALASSAHGFRLPLMPRWRPVPPSPAEPPVVAIAAARRDADGQPFAVEPRLEITSEPTSAPDAESAFRLVKADVESLGERPQVEVTRTSLGFRPLGPHLVGDLNVRYRVGGLEGREVRHRSLLVWRPASTPATVLSITATYLAMDLDRVAPEVQTMFGRIELSEPSERGHQP